MRYYIIALTSISLLTGCYFNPVYRSTTGLDKPKKDNSLVLGSIISAILGIGTGSVPASPVVTNIHDKGIINTGFIIGTAETNVTSVEVSIDNEAYSTATGVTNWKFKLPSGTSTWKDNSQHTISVRSKNGSGNLSKALSVTVRKGENKDLNGDGYEDAYIDGAFYNAGQGRVYIFYSTGINGITQTLASSADKIITGEAGTGYFGNGISTGDINGDGYADLIVGAWLYNTAQGRIYIFYSAGSSGIEATTAGSADKIITGEAGTSAFGGGVTQGDINGDGYTDLVIGSSAYNTNWGRTYIFYSTGTGGITSTLASSADKIIDGEAISMLGTYITTGDLNGDGYSDVIISGYGYNTNQGRSYIFYSAGTGGISQTLVASADKIITGQVTNNNFGQGLATGDINGDGFLDLVIGAPVTNSSQGRLYIFYSTGAGGITQTLAGSANKSISGEIVGDDFGNCITTGDFNGDGYSDIVASAFSYSAGSHLGRSYIFYSTVINGITQTLASSADKIITGEAGAGYFGWGSQILDVNADGFDDIIIGATNYNVNQGRAYIFHSTGIGGISPVLAGLAEKIITGEAASKFARWRY